MIQRLRQFLDAAGRTRQALLILVLAGTIFNGWTALDAASHLSSAFTYASGKPGDVFTPPDDPEFLEAIAADLKQKDDELEKLDTVFRMIEDRCAALYPAYGAGPAATAQRACVEGDPRFKAARAASDAATGAGLRSIQAMSAAGVARARYDQWRGERAHYDAALRQDWNQAAKIEFGIFAGALVLWLALPRPRAAE